MTRKAKAPARRTPQKTIALSVDGREAWDILKGKVETRLGMPLTHEQVIQVLLREAS